MGQDVSRHQVREAVVAYLAQASGQTTFVSGAPTLPVTISGSNDTFHLTVGANPIEAFTIPSGTYTTLAALALAVEAAAGTLNDTLNDYCYVTSSVQTGELTFTMASTAGPLLVGSTLTEGNGGLAAIGFSSPSTFAVGSVVVPNLVNVFGFPAKITDEGDLYPQDDPGVQTGTVIYCWVGNSHDKRIAMGGAHAGEKWVAYDVTLRCMTFSQKALSQAAGQDNEDFLDGLVTAIRADRNCGSPGVVFQWGEGGEAGGEDIRVVSYYPQNLKGKLSATLTVSDVSVQVVQVLLT